MSDKRACGENAEKVTRFPEKRWEAFPVSVNLGNRRHAEMLPVNAALE